MRRLPGVTGGGLPLVVMVRRGVGDVIWHLPTFRALARRSPEGKIAVAMRPSTGGRDVLKAEPLIDHVVYLPAKGAAADLAGQVSTFRRERPSSIWVMEKVVTPSLAAFLAGVPERHGYGMGARSQEMWLNTGPNMPRDARKLHCLDKLDLFDRLNGLETNREVDLALDPATVATVAARFADLPRPWAVFGVGASEPWRVWPAERFAEVAAALRDRIGTLFWFGGPREGGAVAAALEGREDQPPSVRWFDRPLDEGAALLSLADVFMGPDSGPMNLAAAVGTPALGLYGPSRVLSYSRRLHAAVSPDGTMQGLSADQAAQALAPFLDNRRPAP